MSKSIFWYGETGNKGGVAFNNVSWYEYDPPDGCISVLNNHMREIRTVGCVGRTEMHLLFKYLCHSKQLFRYRGRKHEERET